jgi:glycosyltransferase involved in cell wall biosynthesis
VKILLVIDSLKRGGKERQFYELVRKLKNRSDIELCILIRFNIVEFPQLLDLGYKIYIPKSPSSTRFIFYLNRIIKKEKPDLINSWEGFVTTNCIILGFIKRIKVINFDIQYALRIKINSIHYIHEKINQILAYKNIANSHAGLRTFRLVASEKNRVIYNGFDLDRIDQAENIHLRERLNLRNSKVVCMVASFTSPKDYRTVIEGGKILVAEHPEVFFILIGDGPEKVLMQSLMSEAISKHFIFLGRRTDVESIIKEIDIGILLSKRGHAEGISNSIMEYMAAGKPVIATDTGGNSELVLDGKTGYLIPHQDVEELIRKIKFLLNNPRMGQEMGKLGRRRIEHNFALDRMVNDFIELYSEGAQ